MGLQVHVGQDIFRPSITGQSTTLQLLCQGYGQNDFANYFMNSGGFTATPIKPKSKRHKRINIMDRLMKCLLRNNKRETHFCYRRPIGMI